MWGPRFNPGTKIQQRTTKICLSHNSEIFHRWQNLFTYLLGLHCQDTQKFVEGWMSVIAGRDHCIYGRDLKCLWSAWNWLEETAEGLAWQSLQSCLRRAWWDDLWDCFGKEHLSSHHDWCLRLSGPNMLTYFSILEQVEMCICSYFSKSLKLNLRWFLNISFFFMRFLVISDSKYGYIQFRYETLADLMNSDNQTVKLNSEDLSCAWYKGMHPKTNSSLN